MLYLVASARDCLDEPPIYGPFRLVDGVSRLAAALPDDPFVQSIRDEIEREKVQVMGDRERFAAWLDDLLRRVAAEAKRRNLAE